MFVLEVQNWHDFCFIRSFNTFVRLPVAEWTHNDLSKKDKESAVVDFSYCVTKLDSCC